MIPFSGAQIKYPRTSYQLAMGPRSEKNYILEKKFNEKIIKE